MKKPPIRTPAEDYQRREALKRALELAPFTKQHFAELCGVSPSYIYNLTGNNLFSSLTGVSDRVWESATRYLGAWLESPELPELTGDLESHDSQDG